MTALLLPQGKQQYFTPAGVPLVGGKLFTYDAGTNNPRTTWADALQVGANANPIILDGRGEASIFWFGSYKVQLQDSLGNVIWTQDNVGALSGSNSVLDNYSVDSGAVNAYVAAAATPMPGYVAGLRIALKIAATNTGPSTLNYMGLGVKNIRLQNGTLLAGGELQANGVYELEYDGASFQLLNPAAAFWRTAREVTAGVLPTNYSYQEGDVRRYGVIGDGATPNKAALQAIMNTGFDLYFPPGIYLIESAIQLQNKYQRIYGAGNTSELRFTFAADAVGLTILEDDVTNFAEEIEIDHLYLHATAHVTKLISVQGPLSRIHHNHLLNASATGGHGIYCENLNEAGPPNVESFGHRFCDNYIYGNNVAGSFGIRIGDRNQPLWINNNSIGFFDTLIAINGTLGVADIGGNFFEPAINIGVDINPPSSASTMYNIHIHDNYFEEVPVSVTWRQGDIYTLQINDNYSYSHTAVSNVISAGGPAPFFWVAPTVQPNGQISVQRNSVEAHSSIFYLSIDLSLNGAGSFADDLKSNIAFGGTTVWTAGTTTPIAEVVYRQRHFNPFLSTTPNCLVSGAFLSQSISRMESKNADFRVPLQVTVGERLESLRFTYSPNAGTGCTVTVYKSPSNSVGAPTALGNVTVNTNITAKVNLAGYTVEPGYNFYAEVVYDNTGTSGYIYPLQLYLI